MKKILLFIATLLLSIPYFVEASEDSSIEHIGGDTILRYNGDIITINDKSIDYNTQNCPEGYHKGTADDWSKLIKMRYKIDGSNYKYTELETVNDFYSIKEEWLAGEIFGEDNVGLYAFKNDVLNGDRTTYFRTTSKGYQNKPYIFVYQEPEYCLSGTVGYRKDANCGSLKLMRCTTVYVKPKKERNVCNENLKTRCFKNEKVTDIDNVFSKEYNDAYIFAYENKITTMPTIEKANMTGEIIRAEIAKMFSNWMKSLGYELNTQKQCKFTDTKSVQGDLAPAIIESCQFGVMGQGITKFRPFDKITKGEVATAISRIIWGDKYNGGEPFYINHINALIQEGIIDNTDNVNTNELRGNVMLMLMKANEVIKNNNDN